MKLKIVAVVVTGLLAANVAHAASCLLCLDAI